MNRRGFVGMLTGLAAAAGLTRAATPPKPAAQEFVLLKRIVQHVEVTDERYRVIGLEGTGSKYHWFTAPLGVYEAADLESPTTGDSSKLRAFGITPTGERVVFTPKPGH